MNVVITNVTGLNNRGVEAMLVATLEALRTQQPAGSVSILTETPDYDRAQMPLPNVNFVRDDLHCPFGQSPSLRHRVAARLGWERPFGAAEEALAAASLVLAAGGDMFSSDYGDFDSHLSRQLRPLRYAQRHRVPVAFLAQSVGPFRTAREREAWTCVAMRSPLVMVREQLSYDYVTRELRIPCGQVQLTADPAFLLQPAPPDTVRKLRCYHGIGHQRPTIALAISGGISCFAGIDRERHFAAWRRTMAWLIDECDAQVILIPHVQGSWPNDDRLIESRLKESFDYDPRIRYIGGERNAAEYKGLIAGCDMVIAERMHAAIAGLSSGVCTVAVGYSVKAEGILTDCYGPDPQAQGWLLPVGEFVEGVDVADRIRAAWQHREQGHARLMESLPGVQARAGRNFELLAQFAR